VGKGIRHTKKGRINEKQNVSGTAGCGHSPGGQDSGSWKTLHVNASVVVFPVQVIVLLSVFLLSVEFVLRIPDVRRRLPVPILGTGNFNFDVTWEYFQRTRNRYGHIDCVLLGSSMMKHAVEPGLFEKRFGEKSGHNITCFNFGVSGMNFPDIDFCKSMAEKSHPLLLVSEVTPLMLYEEFQKEQKVALISKSPWGRFQSGEFSLKGWLLAHSLLFRYFMKSILWIQSPEQYNRLKIILRNMKTNGFLMRSHGAITGNKKKYKRVTLRKILASKTGNTQMLDSVLDVFSRGAPAVFLEMPLKGKTGPAFRGKDKKFSTARRLLRKTIEKRKKLLFSPGEQIDFGKDCWLGNNHLNPKGAEKFTVVFADQLADKVASEKINWRGAGE